MSDPWKDPGAQAWARDVEANMVPAMRASGVVAPLWTGEIDAKLAVEIGASVLMDKPLILLVQAGTSVPDKLVRVADRIVEMDTTVPGWEASLSERFAGALGDLLEEGRRG